MLDGTTTPGWRDSRRGTSWTPVLGPLIEVGGVAGLLVGAGATEGGRREHSKIPWLFPSCDSLACHQCLHMTDTMGRRAVEQMLDAQLD